MADISKITTPNNTTYNIKDASAIENITRSGTTFTATRRDGTTFTFTQQDNNTTYSAGTGLSLTSNAFSVKLGYTTSGNNRAVQADSNGNLYVTQKDDNTTYTAATAAPGDISSSAGAAGSSTNYARQDHTHKIALATGDSNGQVKIAGTNVSVKGLGSNAYTSTAYAPLASPALTGTPTAPTAAAGTNTTQIATTAYVISAFQANDAMVFKGTIGSSGATVTALPNTHYQGWTYRVITAGTYAGKACEIGDMIICVTDGTATNNDHWTVVQTNIDGAVIGPSSATDGAIPLYSGTTGKLIKNSSYTPSSFATSGHTHATTLAADTGTSSITLAYGGKYKLTTGGTNVIFTMPASDNTNTDTLVTQTNSTTNADYRVLLSLSANDTTETKGSYKSTNFKANPSTGKFRATSFNVADHVTQQYNSTTQALDFIFS